MAIGDEKWWAGPFGVSQVDSKGLRDPCVGGPFFCKEILSVRVPRIPGSDVDAFVECMRSVGQLPLHVDPEHVEIRGHEDSAGNVQLIDKVDGGSRGR